MLSMSVTVVVGVRACLRVHTAHTHTLLHLLHFGTMAPPLDCSAPWDRFGRGNVSSSGKVLVVSVPNTRAGMGNKLFMVGAGVALAERLRLPLLLPAKSLSATLERKGFPCIRSSPALRGLRRDQMELVLPNFLYGSNLQDVSMWGTANGTGRPRGRAMPARWRELMRRSMRPQPATGRKILAPPPPDDDLVIHFRDLRDCSGWIASRGQTHSRFWPSKSNRWFHRLEFLFAQPPPVYDAIIALHRQRFPHATVWVVCQPCDCKHPTVQGLTLRWPVRFLTAHHDAAHRDAHHDAVSTGHDFVWLMSAKHLVLSPSTFGWWAAFLSTRAESIHYPLHPAFSPWGASMWCHLVPEDDSRYVFHDVWANATWRGGGNGSGGREARRRCDIYVRACLNAAHACAVNETGAAAARSLSLGPIDDWWNVDSLQFSDPAPCCDRRVVSILASRPKPSSTNA